MIAAILKAQLLSMRRSGRRGATLGIVAGALWYALWCLGAWGVFGMAATASSAGLRTAAPLAFLFVFIYWQAAPVLSATLGSSLDLRKLLVYPAPHGKLFAIDLLLRLTAGFEMLLVLAGGTAGLAVNPFAGVAALPRLLVAVLVFTLFNLLFASGLRSVLERLMTRKVRELVAFVIPLLFVAPRLIAESGVQAPGLGGWTAALNTPGAPWTAAARVVLWTSPGPALLALAGWTLLAAWFGRSQFERSLRFDAAAAQATSLAGGRRQWRLVEWFYRAPSVLFADPLAVFIEKELRSLARTPRFRMVLVMGVTFGPMVWLPFVIGKNAGEGFVAQRFLPIVSLYALTLLGQVSYWNSFGFDRSAVQLYFLVPRPFRSALMGKNLAALAFVYLEAAALAVGAVALGIAGLRQTAEAFAVISVCALYMTAAGNMMSINYPRPLNAERVSRGGAAGRLQGIMFLLYPLALAPVGLAYLAWYALNSGIVFAVLIALAGAIGAMAYWIAMESALEAVRKRQEAFLGELASGEGPVASD